LTELELFLSILLRISAVALAGLLQAGPAILSSDDIGDNYSDTPPADLRARPTWLGLFITDTGADEKGRASRLEATQVGYVPRTTSSGIVYRIVTTPPGAALLISGVPSVSAGPAVTLGRSIDLSADTRETEFSLGNRVYRIRLEFKEPHYCDAVITFTSGGRTQKLFDATEPGATRDPALVVACDEPHFKIHWAGDLDRDGRVDMLVTFSHKYSYFPRQLLLSSAAGSGDLVAEVGRYERFSQ
jgi:hypothetical protein